MAAAKGFLYLVADGVGGHQGGEVASRIAAQVTREVYYGDSNGDIGTSLRLAIEEANRRIYHHGISSPNEYGMSTTITAAVVRGNAVFVANVGDSRGYLIREGRAHQLTTDHTLVEEQRRAGILTAQEANNHPRRNVITRSLGSELQVSVDIFGPRPLAPGDKLLLCSDGLSDLVSEREIAQVVTHSQSPAAAVRRFIDLAKRRGAPDNVTAVVVEAGTNRRRSASRLSSQLGNLTSLAAAAVAVILLAGTIVGLRGLLPMQWRSAPATRTVIPSPRGTRAPEAVPPATASAELPAAILVKPADGTTYAEQERVRLEWDWHVDSVSLPSTVTRKLHFVVEVTAEERAVVSETVRLADTWAYELQAAGKGLAPGAYEWHVHIEKMVAGAWETLPGSKSQTFAFEVLAPTPTPTPTVTPTPPPQVETPTLVAPADGSQQSNPVTFQWDGSLTAGQTYEVEARHSETDIPLKSGPLETQTWTENLPAESHGEWTWTVLVIQDGGVIATSEQQVFQLIPAPSGGDDGDEATPTSTPEDG
jgi:protein phosphatase